MVLSDYARHLFEPHRYKVLYGGRGSGKSFSVATTLVYLANNVRVRILCCREIQNSIRDSSYQILKDSAERLGISHNFTFKETEIVNNLTGSRFIFSGLLRNENSIRSKEGIDICWVEEASSVSKSSWDVLIPTIRKAGSEIWLTFNPLTVDDPTNRFIDNPPPNAWVQKVNYTENPFFPDVLRQEMEYDKRNDYERYLHVWEGYPLTISDAQIFKGKYVVESFPDDLWQSADRLFFGADFGFARDPSTLTRCFMLDNDLYIEYEAYGIGVEINELKHFYSVVPGYDQWPIYCDSARPETISYLANHDFLNAKPAEKWQGSVEDGIEYLRSFNRIVIHPRCKHTADEFRLYSYKTDRLTNEILPIPLDKNNHCVDEGTLIETSRGAIPVEDVRVGDYVLTRAGYRKVLFSAITGENRKLLEITTLYNTLRCTPEHRIYTLNRGFVEAQNLTKEDTLLCLKSTEYSLMDIGGIDTLNQNAEVTGFTSNAPLRVERFGFTGISGRKQTGLFQKMRTSITKMGIRSTMIFQILNVLLQRLTHRHTLLSEIVSRSKSNISITSEIKRKSGTLHRKATNGTRNTPKNSILGISICQKKSALYVEKHSNLKHITTNSVQTLVNQRGDESRVLMTSRKPASYAERYLSQINIENKSLAVCNVERVTSLKSVGERVYDLTIDGQHEFFASGILVHNCIDGIRYALNDYIKAKSNGYNIQESEESQSPWLSDGLY